ncbi:MAG: hypothetical protein IJA91_07265, partial [Clostridia bacterium]|nr:hypothetical protein [Clostridia bacterium]
MKRMISAKALALLLSVLMVLTCFTVILTVSAAGATEHTVQNGTGNREPIRIGQGFSYRASVKYSFNSFGFNMPTWEKKDSACTLYLYKWQGSYED